MSKLISLLLASALGMMSITVEPASAQGLNVKQIASGIYMFMGVHEQMTAENKGAIANAGFIVGSRSVAVIDPGGSPLMGDSLAQAIKAITDLPVSHVVLTHFHPDHIAGLNAFLDAKNIVAHENYSRALAQRAQFYLDRFHDVFKGDTQSVFTLPTRVVAIGQSMSIDLGDRTLSVVAHKLAHTDNDVTVHDNATNTLWASDLVFSKRTPALDGSLIGWLDVLSELKKNDYKLVVPGHGNAGTWDTVTAPQVLYLRTLRDEVRQVLALGNSLSEVIKEHDASKVTTSTWMLFAEQHGNNLTKAYSELEWK